jgi:tyrosine decarboxylase/aspartate 1-decarboxylase
MRLTRRLASGIEKINGLELVVEPELNIVAFRSSVLSLRKLNEALEAKGWLASLNQQPKSMRLVVMPHHRLKHITSFLSDLKECVEALA